MSVRFKVYKINRRDTYPVFYRTATEVRRWHRLNPGESTSVEHVSVIDTLRELGQAEYDFRKVLTTIACLGEEDPSLGMAALDEPAAAGKARDVLNDHPNPDQE